jgi:hypothetical protein
LSFDVPRPSATRTEEFIDPIGGKFRYKERRGDGTTWYRVKDGCKHLELVSVTTICGIGFDEWAQKNEAEGLLKAVQLTQEYEEERSTYRFNGVAFPDLETVVPAEVLEWKWRKAVRGHVMHEAVEMFLMKGDDFVTTETDRAAMWRSWLHWWGTVKHRVRPLGCEILVANFDDDHCGSQVR